MVVNFPHSLGARRKKDRPNQLGLCTIALLEQIGRSINVKYLDAIDGTPVGARYKARI